MFEVENLIQLLEFKWDAFAYPIWYVNFIAHVIYMIILVYFIFEVYIDEDKAPYVVLNMALSIAIAYPFAYEVWKVYKQGLR